jgi:hypothetical protein
MNWQCTPVDQAPHRSLRDVEDVCGLTDLAQLSHRPRTQSQAADTRYHRGAPREIGRTTGHIFGSLFFRDGDGLLDDSLHRGLTEHLARRPCCTARLRPCWRGGEHAVRRSGRRIYQS